MFNSAFQYFDLNHHLNFLYAAPFRLPSGTVVFHYEREKGSIY